MTDSLEDITSQRPEFPLGRQILVDLYDCKPECLNQIEVVKRLLIDVAEAINVNVIDSAFHQFAPCGVSGVLVISESHISIHTWPEFRYAAVDVFTCGDKISPAKIQAEISDRFGAKRSEKQSVHRGHLPSSVKKTINPHDA